MASSEENFTVEGLADTEVCIGDHYRIGDALFEVTQPRVTWQVEMARLCRLIEPGQHARHLVGVLRVYLAAVVVFIQASKAPMAKPPDHAAMVK
jgi:hypothetical protein